MSEFLAPETGEIQETAPFGVIHTKTFIVQ